MGRSMEGEMREREANGEGEKWEGRKEVESACHSVSTRWLLSCFQRDVETGRESRLSRERRRIAQTVDTVDTVDGITARQSQSKATDQSAVNGVSPSHQSYQFRPTHCQVRSTQTSKLKTSDGRPVHNRPIQIDPWPWLETRRESTTSTSKRKQMWSDCPDLWHWRISATSGHECRARYLFPFALNATAKKRRVVAVV